MNSNAMGTGFFKRDNPNWITLRTWLNSIPVIDTHEHFYADGLPVDSVFDFFRIYDLSDFNASAFGADPSPQEIFDQGFASDLYDFDTSYALLAEFLERTQFTAYARGMLRSLQLVYGIPDLSKESLRIVDRAIRNRTGSFCSDLVENSGIEAIIVDVVDLDTFYALLSGEIPVGKRVKLVVTLPELITLHAKEQVTKLGKVVSLQIRSLDEYVAALKLLMNMAKEFGVAAVKDQSAYSRTIRFEQVTKGSAERAFNALMAGTVGDSPADSEAVKILGDYLFHRVSEILAVA
jgi:hypothetical protein